MVELGMSLANKPGQKAQNAAKIVTQTLARASTVLRMFPMPTLIYYLSTSLHCNGNLLPALTTSMIDMAEDVASCCKGYVKSV